MDNKKLNILLIEDNDGDAFLIRFYLLDTYPDAYDLKHVSYLKQGLTELSERHYDIVLTDLGLPDSFGIDTVKEILKFYPNQCVIVMTGLNDEQLGLSTLSAGAQEYLVKGKFDSKILHSTIRYALERFHASKDTGSESIHNIAYSSLKTLLEMISGALFMFDEEGTLLYAEGGIIPAGVGNAIDWIERTGLSKKIANGNFDSNQTVADNGKVFHLTFKQNSLKQLAVLVQLAR